MLDLYLPEKPAEKPLPLIVFIHGGGWKAGSKAGAPVAAFVPAGYAAASVEYRFSDKAIFPAQIQDCQAAIRWLRAHSAEYKIDPDHIGVWGPSAGGHLVALLGTSGGKHAFAPVGGNEEQSDRVQAVCDWFGPADFNTVMPQADADPNVKNIFKFNTPSDPYSCLIGAPLGQSKEQCDAVSPVHYVSQDNPAFLIMHGDHDTLVPVRPESGIGREAEGGGSGRAAAAVPQLRPRRPGVQPAARPAPDPRVLRQAPQGHGGEGRTAAGGGCHRASTNPAGEEVRRVGSC